MQGVSFGLRVASELMGKYNRNWLPEFPTFLAAL